jgi:hypothetical protein
LGDMVLTINIQLYHFIRTVFYTLDVNHDQSELVATEVARSWCVRKPPSLYNPIHEFLLRTSTALRGLGIIIVIEAIASEVTSVLEQIRYGTLGRRLK